RGDRRLQARRRRGPDRARRRQVGLPADARRARRGRGRQAHRPDPLFPAARSARPDRGRRMGPAQLQEPAELAAGGRRRIRRLFAECRHGTQRRPLQGLVMKAKGFTLVELMVVLTVIALLLSIVVPDYVGRVKRAEEAVLRENLTMMRDALDKHYADAGRYPGTLDDLVSKRYLRAIPQDPFTRSPATWVAVP